MKRHHTLGIIIIVLCIWLWVYLKPSAHAEPQKSDKEIYSEQWKLVGEYKYDEEQANNKALESKKKKDELLNKLNTTGKPQSDLK